MTSIYKLLAARFITQWWPWVIAAWIVIAIALKSVAPSWNSIAQDGDFQFLPAESPSRVGQRWLEQGFPDHRARSQVVIILARKDAPIAASDLAIGLDISRRLMHSAGVAHFRRWLHTSDATSRSTANRAFASPIMRLASSELPIQASHGGEQDERSATEERQPAEQASLYQDQPRELKQALAAFDEAISLDQQWFDMLRESYPTQAELTQDRLALCYWDRAGLHAAMGNEVLAKADRDTALLVAPTVASVPAMARRSDFEWDQLLDVWTWKDPVLGSKLGENHRNARMVVLQMQTEFIATSNIALMKQIETLIQQSKDRMAAVTESGLEIGISGSAAVGGDMLRAASLGVKQTEWVTIMMVLAILAIIYRGPFLIAIPLMTIGLSLVVSTSLIAILANDPQGAENQNGLQVFTTTRIFLVVLLFGAGTDFCLFLIARCREAFAESFRPSRRHVHRIIASSWISVHDALLGSALTTIVGLGLMYFSEFAKFSFTGPIIGLALSVTILVCLTFTPAVVCGLGPLAFWPAFRTRSVPTHYDQEVSARSGRRTSVIDRFWEQISLGVVAFPRRVLVFSLVLLGIPAMYGWVQSDWVTYDFAHELSANSPSRIGTRLVESFFSTRDSSPLTVVIARPTAIQDDRELRAAIEELRQQLYVPEVLAVRSLTDPLGDFPPERRVGLFAQDAWRRRLLENHRSTQQLYVTSNPDYINRVARFDVLLKPDPFSAEAEVTLGLVRNQLQAAVDKSTSPWKGSEFALTGTTPGIADLKAVTQADQKRIQILVTIGVWLVLLVILRRFWMSSYLILTVLLSYLTTLGITLLFFQWAYGADFIGLDWKVPLFLFVILVAVGQDYNVYLTTRVLEEQSKHGPVKGLKRAMVSTGGIITSCGIVMAATFISMTSGAVLQYLADMGVNLTYVGLPDWMSADTRTPILRGIAELGFALALGVLIDTLYVRSVMVPAMFAWMTRRGKLRGEST